MSDRSGIEWTDATWNPLVGCTKVSPGCDNCYALGEVNRRHAAALSPKTSPKMLEAFPARFDVVSMRPARFLEQPLRWTKPRRIFVNSLSDLFHADVPDEFIAQVFAVMSMAPQHTFQLLTKRHARMRALLSSGVFKLMVNAARMRRGVSVLPDSRRADGTYAWPLPNLWLGVSAEDQAWAEIRVAHLLLTPAAVRWVSAEPLLGPIDLTPALPEDKAQFVGLDWVVVGGESGTGARPMHPRWARDLRDQCAAADVPFLFKQWGNWRPPVDSDGPWDTGRGRAQRLPAFLVADRDEPGVGAGTVHCHTQTAGSNPAVMLHVGKKAAGRELDGRTHDGYPAAVLA